MSGKTRNETLKRKFINYLKEWANSATSIYVLVGLIIINVSLYYLYYSLAFIFAKGIRFLFKVTGEETFPLFGFCLSIIPPLIASHIIFVLERTFFKGNHLEQTSKLIIIRVFSIFIAIISALTLTLTFIPLSLTIFTTYFSLAGITAFIFTSHNLIKSLKLPDNNKKNKKAIVEMRHSLLTTLLAYSIWGIIFIIVTSVSVLLSRYAPSEIVERSGLYWLFTEGQIILYISLMVYYVIGFAIWVTLVILRKILEVEGCLP